MEILLPAVMAATAAEPRELTAVCKMTLPIAVIEYCNPIGVQIPILTLQVKNFKFPDDQYQTEDAGYRLCQHGSKSCTKYSPVKDYDKQQIQSDIEYSSQNQEYDRRDGISKRTQVCR